MRRKNWLGWLLVILAAMAMGNNGSCQITADEDGIVIDADDDDQNIFDEDTWEDWFDKPIVRHAL